VEARLAVVAVSEYDLRIDIADDWFPGLAA
jgi:hypothetical protein